MRLLLPSKCRSIGGRLFTLLLLASIVLGLRAEGKGSQTGDSASSQSQAPTAPSENAYVTSATCGSCHEDFVHAFSKNPHQILEISDTKGWRDQSCESCHG